MKYFTADYIKLFFSLLFFTLIAYPFVSELWNKEYKKMVQDMKGENGRWDWSEIWEHYSLRFARGFFIAIMFMILMQTIFATAYPWELYILVFTGTLGSNGVGAFLIYLKSKAPIEKK
jgi:hypothetical protein